MAPPRPCGYETLGGRSSGWGAWTVCADGLTNSSVVFSVGTASDVTFDVAVVRRFGAQVVAFDPTITRDEFDEAVDRHNLSRAERSRLTFFPFGLGATNDVIPFYRMKARKMWSAEPPPRGNGSSRKWQGTSSLRAPVLQLRSLGFAAGVHQPPDLLKMDVEGLEYAIVEAGRRGGWLSRWPPAQIAVELHERQWKGLRPSKRPGPQNMRLISTLEQACGYRTRFVDQRGQSWLFERQQVDPQQLMSRC
jgi:FkbM family methyltransferase